MQINHHKDIQYLRPVTRSGRTVYVVATTDDTEQDGITIQNDFKIIDEIVCKED